MTPEKQRAIGRLRWCRRADELVDGPNASHITQRLWIDGRSAWRIFLPETDGRYQWRVGGYRE